MSVPRGAGVSAPASARAARSAPGAARPRPTRPTAAAPRAARRCAAAAALGATSCSNDSVGGGLAAPRVVAAAAAAAARRGARCACRGAVRHNPQNVPQVEVTASPALSAREAVEAQLKVWLHAACGGGARAMVVGS
jgi:hypothetical protein